jgi:3-isopropylmalate/(R)-2-methylmalate dehydratase small subunit
MNIGVLPVQVKPEFLENIFEEVNKDPQAEILVNLPDQFVEIKSTGNRSKFEINEYKKENLLNGFDDIDYLINIKSEIINFSKSTPL